MNDAELYSDDQCRYLGGDPRLDDKGPAEFAIRADGIRIRLRRSDDVPATLLHIPNAAIQGMRTETQRRGMEQAEYEAEVLIGPDEWITLYTAIVNVKDPEGVLSTGWDVRLAFRNDYYCRLFEKRCREALNLPPL